MCIFLYYFDVLIKYITKAGRLVSSSCSLECRVFERLLAEQT